MKTNCPCGGLLNSTVAGRLFVWLVHVRLFGFVLNDWVNPPCLYFLLLMYFFCSVGWHSVLPDLSLVLSGMAQTVCLMDTLFVWLINQSMSWPACPVTVHQCVPEYLFPSPACLFRLWCNQLKLANAGSAVTPPSWTPPLQSCLSQLLPPLTDPSFEHRLVEGLNKVKTFSHVASYTSLCLLNLRASTDFHWERKTSQRET